MGMGAPGCAGDGDGDRDGDEVVQGMRQGVCRGCFVLPEHHKFFRCSES